jgi:hypothetical protein
MAQYSKDEVVILVNGTRVVQLKNFDPPEESYNRSYDDTVGDDENVLLNDDTPEELEGEIELSPTSPTITTLDPLVESGDQVPITLRHPEDDIEDNKTYTGAVFTDKAYANSFDDDPESPPNRTYTFIADDIN